MYKYSTHPFFSKILILSPFLVYRYHWIIIISYYYYYYLHKFRVLIIKFQNIYIILISQLWTTPCRHSATAYLCESIRNYVDRLLYPTLITTKYFFLQNFIFTKFLKYLQQKNYNIFTEF